MVPVPVLVRVCVCVRVRVRVRVLVSVFVFVFVLVLVLVFVLVLVLVLVLVFVLVLVLVVLSIRMPKSCRVLVALVTIATAADFEAPHGVSLFPAFSVLDSNVSTPSGLVARLGRGTKSPSNPLFGQTLPWEPRIDNGSKIEF